MHPHRRQLALLTALAACTGAPTPTDSDPQTGPDTDAQASATASESDTEAQRATTYTWAGVLGIGEGDGAGELANPYDVCVGGGFVYVTEGGNDRVSVFTDDGDFVTHWLEDQVGTPKGCLYEGDGLWVADHDAGRVLQVDLADGSILTGLVGFTTPFDLDRGPDGHLWVADYTADHIAVHDGSSVIATYDPGFDAPSGVLTVGDQVWVGDTLNDRVVVLDSEGGQLATYGGDPTLDDPHQLALSADGGAVWVSDQLNNRIQRWTTDGVTEVVLGGTQGSDDGQLFWPFGIAEDEDGVVYVGDLRNHRVARWAPKDSP